MSIRVMRLMEYIYPDIETAHDDMRRWFVQGTITPRRGVVITSAVILEPTSFEMVMIREEHVNEPK